MPITVKTDREEEEIPGINTELPAVSHSLFPMPYARQICK